MSFANRKERIFFRRTGDPANFTCVTRKRSDGRMKTYPSATDRRAWCMDNDLRRRYFLELIEGSPPWAKKCAAGSVGQFVACDILLELLMEGKDFDMEAHRHQIRDGEPPIEVSEVITPEDNEVLFERSTASSETGTEFENASEALAGKDSQINILRSQLLDIEKDGNIKEGCLYEAICRLENIKNILNEREELVKDCRKESEQKGSSAEKDATIQEKEKLLSLISALKKGKDKPLECGEQLVTIQKQMDEIAGNTSLSPEDKVNQLKQELLKLKEYSKKAGDVETERNMLVEKSAQMEAAISDLESELKSFRLQQQQIQDEVASGTDINPLQNRVKDLERQLQLCEHVKEERDKQAAENAALRHALGGSVLADLKQYEAKLDELEQQTVHRSKSMEQFMDPENLKRILDNSTEMEDRIRALMKANKILKDRLKALGEDASKLIVAAKRHSLKSEEELALARAELKRASIQSVESIKHAEAETMEAQNRISDLEKQLAELRKERDLLKKDVEEKEAISCTCDELQEQLSELKQKGASQGNIVAERDALRKRLQDYMDMDAELERLKFKAKDAEVLRMERDQMKRRLDELANIEAAYRDLLDKCKGRDRDCEQKMLKRKIKELECTVADQEEEITKLVAQLERLACKASSDKDLNEELQRLRNERDEALGKLTENEAQLDSLRKENEEVHAMKDHLRKTVADISADSEGSKSLTEQLRGELDEALRKLSECKEKDEEYNRLKKELEELKSDVQNLSCECEDLKSENEALQQKILEYEDRIKNHRQQVMVLVNKLKALENSLKLTSEESLANLKKPSVDLSSELSNLKKERDDLVKTVQCYEHEIESLKSAVNSLKSGESAESKNKDEIIQNLKAQIEEYLKQVENLQEQLKEAGSVAESSSGEKLQQLEDELSKQNANVLQLQNTINGLTSELNAAKLRADEREQKIQELEEALNESEAAGDLGSEVAAKEAKNKELETKVTNLQSELDASNETISELQNKIKELESEMSTGGATAAEAESQVKDLRDELKNKTERISELEATIAEQNETLKNNSSYINELENKIKELEDARDAKASDTSALDDMKKKYEEELAQARDKMKELTAENEALDKKTGDAATLEAELEKLKQTNRELVSAVSDYQQTIKSKEAEMKHLTQEGQSTQSDCNERLRKKEEECKRAISKLKEELGRKYAAETKKMQAENTEKFSEIQKLKDELENCKRELQKAPEEQQQGVVPYGDAAKTASQGTMTESESPAKVHVSGATPPYLAKMLLTALLEGIDALSFADLAALHQELHKAARKLLGAQSNSSSLDNIRDRYALAKHLNRMEHSIDEKEFDAGHRVQQMQLICQTEKKWLHLLKQIALEENARGGQSVPLKSNVCATLEEQKHNIVDSRPLTEKQCTQNVMLKYRSIIKTLKTRLAIAEEREANLRCHLGINQKISKPCVCSQTGAVRDNSKRW